MNLSTKTFETAQQHHRAGRLAEAERLCQEMLSAQPDHIDALQMLAMLALQSGRAPRAIELLRRAVHSHPQSAACHGNLGLVLASTGRRLEAVTELGKALTLEPASAELHYNLGKVQSDSGKLAEAIVHYENAVRLRPDFAAAWNNLGNSLNASGQVDQAIETYRRALQVKPDNPEAHYNLGTALQRTGRWDQSIGELRQAILLRPNYADAYNNLGLALQESGQLDPAIEIYRRGLSVQADHVGLNCNLGAALKDVGRVDEAIASFRRATSHHLDARAAGNVLYALQFKPEIDLAALRDEHRRWDQIYAKPLGANAKPHLHLRNSDRRLRVGYVSPHFRDQWFLRPLLANHDRGQFEIFCYDNGGRRDPFARLEDYADQWRLTGSLSDEQIAEMVRQDEIDVLVDLAAHTNGNRLLVFARKPAPVQVTWLGYPGTTGMEAMDYRITDPYIDPPGPNGSPGPHDEFYAERSIRLPDSFWCYDPLTNQPPVNDLPALQNGFVTFGCLNNFGKINDLILDLWGTLLLTVSNSRLMVLVPPGVSREGLTGKLGAKGIAAARIECLDRRPREGYLRSFNGLDISLDTFPYNGHTTTLESLWMGVPVVGLVGDMPFSRASLSLLSNVGLAELAANGPQHYLEIAASLASDLPKLAGLRSSLRGRLERSPLTNGARFARNMETAYRGMWRRWCAGGR